jgi:hypothetical protein
VVLENSYQLSGTRGSNFRLAANSSKYFVTRPSFQDMCVDSVQIRLCPIGRVRREVTGEEGEKEEGRE